MTIRWTTRADPPVGREQVLDAFRQVLITLGGADRGAAQCVARGPDRGADVGYEACDETWEERWRAGSSDAWLIWTLDPIMASMGVSGEFITVSSRGLSVPIRGRALCSARRPGYAALEPEDPILQAAFAASFGPWGNPDAQRQRQVAREQLREELTYRTLPANDLIEAVAALIAQRADDLPQLLQQLEALSHPADQHQAAITALRSALG